jgi:hypothetical protein
MIGIGHINPKQSNDSSACIFISLIIIRLAENESWRVGMKFEALVELSREAEDNATSLWLHRISPPTGAAGLNKQSSLGLSGLRQEKGCSGLIHNSIGKSVIR